MSTALEGIPQEVEKNHKQHTTKFEEKCEALWRREKPLIPAYFVFVLLIYFHSITASETKQFMPELEILPEVPSKTSAGITSLGDEQFYFRYLTLALQNAGDTFGRATPLQDYDYATLYDWFQLLDTLDLESDFVPSIASYYYSHTQRVEDNRYIVKYLEENYDKLPDKKWFWLGQAVQIAYFILKDKDLALRLTNKLEENPDPKIPMWMKQMSAVINSKAGEAEKAEEIIKNLVSNAEHYSDSEVQFLARFLNRRMEASDAMQEVVNGMIDEREARAALENGEV